MENLPIREIFASAALIATIVGTRVAFERYIFRREKFISDHHRRLLSNAKNATFFILLIGLVLIWAPSLRTFAFSLAAFIVAIIIATKELILCLSGAFLRTTAKSFRVGDWVEVSGIRGQVIDQNLFSVQLQEIALGTDSYAFTGRTVTVPNSLFLTTPIKNENFFKRYVFHAFSLVVDKEVDVEAVEKTVLASLRESMADHAEIAERYNSIIERKAGLDIMGTEPFCNYATEKDGRLRLNFTAFLPTKLAVDFEQAAIRRALPLIRTPIKKNPAEHCA